MSAAAGPAAEAAAALAAAEPLLGPYLGRQTWYRAARAAGGGGPAEGAPEITAAEVLREGPAAGLARLLVAAGELRLQVVVGWREASSAASVLRGRESAILGACAVPGAGELLVYDAVADEELLRALLGLATGGRAAARRARVVESLTSHASIVYDDRLFMKLYRVLEPAPRPEVEVMVRLDEIGFNWIVSPVAVWRGGDGEPADLALVREFHPDGVEGRALALTSLRDLLGGAPAELAAEDPDEAAARAGGDLASEFRRLGETTARLHLALAEAFGEHDADLAPLADAVSAGDPATAARLRAMTAPGRMIRVHGDYHLRRVMRTDAGWIVVGFGDDPSRAARLPPGGRAAIGTALDDVSDLCRSVDEVASEAAARYQEGGQRARALAGAWARRARAALLDGYLAVPGVGPLLPADRADVEVLLTALAGVRARRAGSPAAG